MITITKRRADAAARQGDERNKKVILKNCALFTDFINDKYKTVIYDTERSRYCNADV